MDALPSLTQVDFAVVRHEGRLVPRLIELQGFPSLSAFEVLQADAWNMALERVPGLPKGAWSPYFSGLDRAGFVDLFRRTIVGGEDPAEVVLLDLEPDKQKTAIDFAATRVLLGVDSVRPARAREGRPPPLSRRGRPARPREAHLQPHRLRRAHPDRRRSPVRLPRGARRPLGPAPELVLGVVESAAFLCSRTKPHRRRRVLSAFGPVPDDVGERYVLKPLFSFAGGGVNVDPTPADVARIPEAERAHWVLMEKIAYDPCLNAVDGGGVKVEVRMMFFRPDGEAVPTLALNLCRLSRGKMLGVDFNKDFTWVGSSVALKPA